MAKGNTEVIAEMIQKNIGGELFEIDTVKNYPVDYTECTNVTKDELKNKFRPELKRYLPSIADYDAIFIGYPCWWGTMPMAVYTFLERYDFAGKKIFPFTTHEGSGLGRSVKEIKKICPKAEVMDGLAIHGAEAAQSVAQVERWGKGKV